MQTQVKTFASETEAASAFAKQVAEKEKKGYSADPLTPLAERGAGGARDTAAVGGDALRRRACTPQACRGGRASARRVAAHPTLRPQVYGGQAFAWEKLRAPVLREGFAEVAAHLSLLP